MAKFSKRGAGGGGGGGEGVKGGGGLDRISVFREGCLERGGNFFQRSGVAVFK